MSERGKGKGLATFALSSSSSSSSSSSPESSLLDHHLLGDEREEERLERRRYDYQYYSGDDDGDEDALLSDFDELEYDDKTIFDIEGEEEEEEKEEEEEEERDVARTTLDRNALVWLRPDVIDGNDKSTGARNKSGRVEEKENELLAWDAVREDENRFTLLMPSSLYSASARRSAVDFDFLYERAFIGAKDFNFNSGKHGNATKCICADESNLVTMCIRAVMGDVSSRRLLRAISLDSLDDSGSLSVRFRGASVGATKNVLSQFYETSRLQNRARAFATKQMENESGDSTANAFQKCVLRILQAIDASLSAFAEACIQRRADEGEEYENEDEHERNANRNDASTTLLEFAFHTRDIRKQIASLAALVDKVQKRWRAMKHRKSRALLLPSVSPHRYRQNGNKSTASHYSYGSVALDVLSREIQDLHYNDYVDIELEQRSVLKLFEILFISTAKPVLVEGIVNACFSSNNSSLSNDGECLKKACDVLLQNKSDAIRKLRSIKNSTRDIHREQKLAQFSAGMRACKLLLFSSTSNMANIDSDATSIVHFFTKEMGVAREEIFREVSRTLDEAIDTTDTLRTQEKDSIEFEHRERVRVQREIFEARVRKHELEREEIRQKAKAKKKELGDARRLEMFERAERKKEAKVNELTEDLERLGTFSGSAVKKRVRLLESQMNRTGEEDTTTDPNADTTGDVFLDVVVAVEENHEAAAAAEEEDSKDAEKLAEKTILAADDTMETDLPPRASSVTYSSLPSRVVMCKRSLVDVTASNLWAFLDFLHEKVSRVHVSYLLKDHEVASHAKYIAEIIFGLSGDVIETLCERRDDDSYDDAFVSSSFEITYFTNDELRDALERANISSNVVKDRFRIVYSNESTSSRNTKSIKCLSYALPEQLKRSNLFGIDFEEKIEAVSEFVLRLKSIRAMLQNLRKISNDLDRATYVHDNARKLDHASKEATVLRRRLRSFQEQLFELERFATHLERSCGENIRHATDVLISSMNALSTEIDANDAKAMLAKWLNACVAASFSSKDFARARKVIEQGFRNIHLFAQQTFNAYNDADPNALLLNAMFISTTNGLRGEFIGSVVRVFPF